MRIARIDTPAGPLAARWEDGAWTPIEDPYLAFAAGRAPRAVGDPIPGDPQPLSPSDPLVVAGIAQPSEPGGQVRAWLKSPRTVVASGTEVIARRDAGRIVIEGEIALVIGKATRGLTADNAAEFVLGVTAVNDVSSPDRGAPDERNFEVKGGAGYTPLGPWIETEQDLSEIALTVTVDGTERVRTGTQDLNASPRECLAYVARWIELGPGDIVMCGAPRSGFTIDPTPQGTEVRIDVADIPLVTRFR